MLTGHNHFGEVHKLLQEDMGIVQEMPVDRSNIGDVLNAESDKIRVVRVGMLTGGSCFGEVHELWHKDTGCV